MKILEKYMIGYYFLMHGCKHASTLRSLCALGDSLDSTFNCISHNCIYCFHRSPKPLTNSCHFIVKLFGKIVWLIGYRIITYVLLNCIVSCHEVFAKYQKRYDVLPCFRAFCANSRWQQAASSSVIGQSSSC